MARLAIKVKSVKPGGVLKQAVVKMPTKKAIPESPKLIPKKIVK